MDARALQVMPVLSEDPRALQVTAVHAKDCRALLEVCVAIKAARPRASTSRAAVGIKDVRPAQPSLPTLPGTDRTIGRQGPTVCPGQLGTLLLCTIYRNMYTCYSSST